MTIHLEIVTPEKVAYVDDVDAVVLPGSEGELGVLPAPRTAGDEAGPR